MTKRLIEGLRTVADLIESKPDNYQWESVGSCQCGLLAQAITGYNQEEIRDYFQQASTLEEYSQLGIWEDIIHINNIEVVCQTTNIPMSSIIRKLLDVGMKPIDFYNLENLADRVTGEINPNYSNPIATSSYIKDWADELEKELND